MGNIAARRAHALEQRQIRQATRASLREKPLPVGWEQRTTREGKSFFVDHRKGKTQWHDPRLKRSGRLKWLVRELSSPPPPLPADQSTQLKSKLLKLKAALLADVENRIDYEIELSRDALLESSLAAVQRTDAVHNVHIANSLHQLLKQNLKIRFVEESGQDLGGMSREWFALLGKALVDDGYLRKVDEDVYKYVVVDNGGDWDGVGRLFAMALLHGHLLDVALPESYYLYLLGREQEVEASMLERVDPVFWQSLQWIADNDPQDLEMVFCIDENGEQVPLKEDGENIAVTNENKLEYVEACALWRLYRNAEESLQELRNGFRFLIPDHLLVNWSAAELEIALNGTVAIDVEGWRLNTQYNDGLDEWSDVVAFFWETVDAMSEEERRTLLKFVTGSARLPVGGFAELYGADGPQKFTLASQHSVGKIPTAHTCFNRLEVSEYEDIEEFAAKLRIALENDHGFHLT